MKKDYLLPASIIVAALLIGVAIIYSVGSKSSPSLNAEQGSFDFDARNLLALTKEDVTLGNLESPITIIEYSDFQCPFCGFFYTNVEPLLKENYVSTGKVKLIYRHFAFLGAESRAAAAASECAKDQGKFWKFHDSLFDNEIKDNRENNGSLNRGLFMSIASDLGFNQDAFAACLDSGKYAQKVENDLTSGKKAGVRATPTTFINDQKVEGALPYPEFKKIIDQKLAK